MKLFSDLEVGAATHTGCVRRTNEDDYLVLMPDDVTSVRERGRLLALADGMGGVRGRMREHAEFLGTTFQIGV